MFADRMGFQQYLQCRDEGTRKGVELWLERVLGYYGENGGVDVAIIGGQLILDEETRAYCYEGDFTPRELSYLEGSRPELEAVLAELIEPDMDDMRRALAIMRRCRDNRDHGLRGGSEEELLKRGAIMCNEISRVFVCLCQIAGLRARVMCSHISGHMMAEVAVDGRWMWVDPMKGVYCLRADGEPASTWDLMQDPTLFERQGEDVLADIRPIGGFQVPGPAINHVARELNDPEVQRANLLFTIGKNRACYFHPREAIALGNYFVWEHHRYSYPWRTQPADPLRLLRARRAEQRHRRELGWPDFYFDLMLFDEDLVEAPQRA